MKKVKVGMISFAHAGHPDSYLSRLIEHPYVDIVGIAESNSERVEIYVEKHDIPYFASYEALLATECDAVIICSEYVHHAEIVVAAARAKKHILCEKPLGLSIAEMQRMIDVCTENDVKFMTAFPCRYSEAIQDVKRIIDEGHIGEVLGIKGTNRGVNPGDWFIDPEKSGGGALMDHTVHVIDLMYWFTRSEVEEVYAVAATKFSDIPVEDAGLVNVKFANGMLGVIDTSWSLHDAFPRYFDLTLEITGTEGIISVDALAERNDLYSNKTKKTSWQYWGSNMDAGLIDAFVDTVLNDLEVPITGADGLQSTAVALATYESLKTRSSVNFGDFLKTGVSKNEAK